MALDFPTSPVDGQIYDNYYWDDSSGVWNSLGNYAVPNLLSNGTFTSTASSITPLTVKGHPSQAANLQEWKNSSGTNLASLSASGGLSLNNALTVANGGTGSTTAANARTALEITPANIGAQIAGSYAAALHNHNASNITSGQLDYARMPAGTVVGFNRIRTSARSAYGYNGDAIISDVNISITPKFSNSLLLVQWQVMYETDYNSVFRVYRDNGLVYTSGYQGYNENDGNTYSGVAPAVYDTDTASTPQISFIQYFVPAGSTATTTLQLSIRSSQPTNATFYLNRSVNSAGSGAYEIGVSTAVIWEIAQ